MTSSHDPSASDEQRRLAADPDTTAQQLADLAAAYPELHPAIAGNPAAYDGLREWIASQAAAPAVAPVAAPVAASAVGLGKGAIIAIVAAGVLVVAGGATALALTFGGPSGEGESSVSSKPSSSATTTSTPTPTPTPKVTSVTLDEPWEWSIYGDSLYRADHLGVEFFTPGVGSTSYTFPDFQALETDSLTVSGGVSFTGPVDDLMFATTAVERTPASGTTPERYTVVVIAAAPGKTPVQHRLWDQANTLYDSESLSTSSTAPVVAVTQTSGSSDDIDIIAGVDLETGEIIWRYDEGITGSDPLIDTMVVMDDQLEDWSITGCWQVYGVEIATGDVLFNPQFSDACAYWSIIQIDYTVTVSIGGEMLVYDRVTGEPVLGWDNLEFFNSGARYDPFSHLALTGDYDWSEDLRVFDTTTGTVVYTMPYSQIEPLRLTALSIWDSKIYAQTSDAIIVLDARTGEVIEESVDWYPILGIHGWTLYSDGLFTGEDRPLT
jgi:hypothetical protein